MLEQLSACLPLLIGGPRDAPERQRSLRAAIDWSYELLDHEETRVFNGLAVFNGGIASEACTAICGSARSTLESLADKNLLVRDAGVPGRFLLLETIREYALDRLQRVGALDEMRRRHAEYFVALAEQAEPELRGPSQHEWLAHLDAEQGNIAVVFAWAADVGERDVPLRLGAALWRYWEARGSIGDARRQLEDALAVSPDRTLEARPAALFASGRMALRQGDLDHARAVFIEGRSLFAAAGEVGGVALCTAGLGWIAHVIGPVDQAVTLCREAVEVARESDEGWIVADALNNLGVALRSEGDLQGSREALEESLSLRRQIGDLEGVTAGLNGLALIAIAQDDFDSAEKLFGEAFAVSERRGDLFYVAAEDVVLAYLAFGRGDFIRATALSVSALESCRQHGYRQFSAYALETLAGVAAAEGRLRDAGRLLGAALALAEQIGRSPTPGRSGSARNDGVTYDWEARAVKLVLQRAARQLGRRAWDAALEEGRRLEFDDAHAFAAEWTALDEREADVAQHAP